MLLTHNQSSRMEQSIRSMLNISHDFNVSQMIQDLMNTNKMRQMHELRMINHSRSKPILIIMEPANVFLDPKCITITNQQEALLSFNNYNSEKFLFGMSCNNKQFYAYRLHLMRTLYLMYRLSRSYGVHFEIVIYSNTLNKSQLITQMSLIHLYFNLNICRSNIVNTRFPILGIIHTTDQFKSISSYAYFFLLFPTIQVVSQTTQK